MAASDAESASEPTRLAVVGGGVAGCAATSWAASRGVKVTLYNSGLPLGGTCIHVGTFPTRLLMSAATDHHRARRPRFDGIDADAAPVDWSALNEQRRQISHHFSRHYQRQFDQNPNVEVVDQSATFAGPNTLKAGHRTTSFDRILLTPGSHSTWPDIGGLDDVTPLSLDAIGELPDLPESIVLLETNDVAIAYAQLLARLGTDVTVLTHRPRLLGEQHCADVSAEMTELLSDEGVEFVTDVVVTHAEPRGGGIRLLGTRADHPAHWDAEEFVIVDHRQPRIEELNVGDAGIELTDHGYIVIDESLQTTNRDVFAAGDAIGRGRHAYAAAYDAILAARNAVYPARTAGHNTAVPFAIYTDPQLAGVGWNEDYARRAGFEADTALYPLDEIPAAHAMNAPRGFVKLIRDRRSDHLVGARIVAPNAAESIMELSVAIRYGLTVSELAALIHPPVSLGEAIARAARTFTNPRHS